MIRGQIAINARARLALYNAKRKVIKVTKSANNFLVLE
jgi:hypothetical protein